MMRPTHDTMSQKIRLSGISDTRFKPSEHIDDSQWNDRTLPRSPNSGTAKPHPGIQVSHGTISTGLNPGNRGLGVRVGTGIHNRGNVGPGIDDADMGPLTSDDPLKEVLEYIDIVRQEAGDPVIGGGRLDRDVYFVEPTIFDSVTQDMRIAQEEIFGPILTVSTFADEEEAIELANATDYGLVAGIYTENVGRAHRFAREVDAGQGGIGRDNGVQAIDNYTQIKNICANIDHR